MQVDAQLTNPVGAMIRLRNMSTYAREFPRYVHWKASKAALVAADAVSLRIALTSALYASTMPRFSFSLSGVISF